MSAYRTIGPLVHYIIQILKEKKIFLANIQDSGQTVYNVASVLFVHCLSISLNTTPVAYY